MKRTPRTHQASDWRELIGEAVSAVWPSLPDGPHWIEAQCDAESAGDPQAVSSAGAQGLLQLMPATAAELGVTNPFDPRENLWGGVTYLRQQFDRKDRSPKWRFDETHRRMREEHGREPTWFGAVLRALLGIAKSGGSMNWDWTKTLWKAVRGALGAALAVAVLSLLGAFDTEAELLTAGVPKWLAPIVAMGAAFVVSWVRNWIAINRPQWNVVKKAGAKVQPALKG